MKKIFFLAFLSPLISSVSLGAWWSPIEKISVTCKADRELYPHIGNVEVRGTSVTIEIRGVSQTVEAQIEQESSLKVWWHPSLELSMGLRASIFGDYHVGSLQLNGSFYDAIPLWCLPRQ